MISDKAEIESVLRSGKRILSERPELEAMSLRDVINELDDGTQQMIHERWGVTAWLVIKSITEFELTKLVDSLSQIESGLLTYEYAGYLLQTECAVNLEALILEAERRGQFDKIVPYISANLMFQVEVHTQHIQQILCMLENHTAHPAYHQCLANYAEHITNSGAQGMVEEILGDLSGQAQYDFMRQLRWDWYHRNQAEACEVIGRMMERGSIWSKKAAIDFLEVGLNYDKAVFRKRFSEIEKMLAKSEELWLMMIPIFTKYVLEATAEEALDELYYQVLEYLKRIPSDSIDARCSFLGAILRKEETSEHLQSIFHAVISQPCAKDRKLLDLLDQNLYTQAEKGEWRAALQAMLDVFRVNQYRTHYQDFFEAMHLVTHQISKYAAEVIIQALTYMLSCDVDQMFFGLGLLLHVGGLKNIQNKADFTGTYPMGDLTDQQMIKLMKAVLYYAFDHQKICHMAFQLLELSQTSHENYIDFCMKEVYGNYPATMHEVAAQYETSGIITQAHLAETVIKLYERSSEEQKQSYSIKDLHPSREHQYIYHMAQVEENRKIRKRADEQSFFANLFARRSMKYGVRSAHIITGRKDQKFYQVSPYQHFKYEVEIPANYVKDPVGYEMQRRAYLSEVIQDATNN